MPAGVVEAALLNLSAVSVPAAKTATFSSSAIDLQALGYEGLIAFILNSAAGTGNADNTLDGKITECDTSGGSYTDVSGATFTQVTGVGGDPVCEAVVVDTRKVKQYLKFTGTIAGTTPSFVVGVTLAGVKKYQS